MDILLDPNVAYLILLAGIFLGFLALVTPGTGLLELCALFCLILAGYAVYHLSFHWWALLILLLSLPPFFMAVRTPHRPIYLAISILFLVLGSVFVFAGGEALISVNPLVAITASGLLSILMWVMLRKSIEAMSRKPSHDLDALIGQVGEARSNIHDDGSVHVSGEMWSARSDSMIPAGSRIRVVQREGFILVVEKINQSN